MRRAPKGAVEPSGSFIYAYCNVRTNQVLYSLTRTLKPRRLKQLPDVGANKTPPTLRKDSWRPFFTVSLTQDEIGRQQSLYIFQRLREYRKLHETNWTPSPLLSRPYTQEEIDEMAKKLDERGGSKKETVYDIIKRKKRDLRVKAVMDQKANSIADLAAILLDQDAAGREAEKQNQENLAYYKLKSAEEMLRLANAARGNGVQVGEQSLKELQQRLENTTRKHKPGLHRKIARKELKIKMTAFAITAVAETRKTVEPLISAEAARYAEAVKTTAEEAERYAAELAELRKRTGDPTAELPEPAPEDPVQKSDIAFFADYLPDWPGEINPWKLAAERKKSDWRSRHVLHHRHLRFDRPVFTTRGIAVRWANPLDAEYAEAWPEAVQQLPMGLSRHTAPLPPESLRHPSRTEERSAETGEGGQFAGDVATFGVAMTVPAFRATQLTKASKLRVARREREEVLDRMKDKVLRSLAKGNTAVKPKASGAKPEVKVVGEAETPVRPETTV